MAEALDQIVVSADPAFYRLIEVESVLAGAADLDVAAETADEQVVAVLALEQVLAAFAEELVVAEAALDLIEAGTSTDDVVAGEPIDQIVAAKRFWFGARLIWSSLPTGVKLFAMSVSPIQRRQHL